MKYFAIMVAACAVVLSTNTACAQEDTKAQRAAFATEICDTLSNNDPFVAIEKIESDGDDKQVAVRYLHLVIDLYSQQKVPEMVTVGRHAIHYLLTQSRAHAGNDEKKAAWFKSLAQMTSFNLASNLWPGWNGGGIVITAEQQKFGFDMARLDLRLVQELDLSANKHSTATWIVGSHHLAASRYDKAKTTFEKSKKHAAATDSLETQLMVEGYIAITEILATKNGDVAQRRLAAVTQTLEKLGTEDANYYASQLQQVLEVFSNR